MAPARTSDTLTPPHGPNGAGNEWSSRPRVARVLAIVTAIGVVIAILGGAAFVIGRTVVQDDTYDRGAREQVTSRATDFATAYNTYDVANIADYQKRLKGLLTSDYDAQFVQVTNAVFTALKDKKQKSGDAKVRAVAIESIDEDSAEAIVAVDATINNTDNKAAVVRHFRWKVSFAKTKGDWLVSNFESVAAVTATAGDPSATPTPAPTATATEGGN